ncbi:hypothetical protein RND71_004318 [Anisodus tanguticus]|uniref:Glycosyltransferase family 92 protein n=1 Tax=Anisodus tanguticus TaxID=243964 RepID=A0AAE1VQV8_9SOLA|nr:hypothetical protein RND71_004318 [Anisodus tanguticus]
MNMAGLFTTLRPTTTSSSTSSSLLYLLTVLSLSLAAFAFVLQWRGGLPDPNIRRLVPEDDPDEFRVMGGSSKPVRYSSGCEDILGQSRTLSFPYYRLRDWKFNFGSDLKPKGVRVIYRTRELEDAQAKSRIWNETWLAGFFYQPCNYELFVKQSLNMEMAIIMARENGVNWIIHLDTDELLHPAGASEYSLRRLLADLPEDVDLAVFPNYESSVERDDVKEPFSEVSMFKKNYDHLPKETYFGNYKEATRGNPNYFLTYGNGKSAARVQDYLRPNGAHRWHNYMKSPKEIKLDEAAVLHYTYPKFSDLTSRRDRCGCKPTKEDVKRCFMLEFDRAVSFYNSFNCDRGGDASLVIIQGLKEYGVFASVIASAHRDIIKEESLSSTGNRNSSRYAHITDTFPRKMGRILEPQATRRKFLEFSETDRLAIPPESPPGMDDIHLYKLPSEQ